MAFKGMNVSLEFSADTSKAKQQIEDLQKTLSNLMSNNTGVNDFALTPKIQEATNAAAQLKSQLQAATDVNTGKLDLSKFSASLKQSGTSLSDYQSKLSAIGPEGEKAFVQLAQSISTADAKITNANSMLGQFAKSLENVARYQISTGVLNSFTGAIQSAYNYAQDLNESLNNIQIVSGQSATQMAAFAKQANLAAQQLSTTTTAYTDAALIFYQQGLSGDDVTKRTNAVTKMAQATGDSATEVSSYMTAIWNNFDDGSESLDHYADVITALGASTASSSSEIAEGLSKFASIAKTTGLSYDYATSALATLVANTRQSADTIGTSLKTIFARLQGFNLGETADDGVTLNKYSTALAKVGVDVLDATGSMKDMDTILDDLASKWDNLGNAQKAALAQTVAGTRQYTTLISLMDNWDDMKTNLNTVQTADGTLDTQAETYAQSWEAAKKRVQAAAEGIYDSLIDDSFFISLNDGLASILQTVNKVIESMGGLKGVLTTVGGILLQVFSGQINTVISKFTTSLSDMKVSIQNVGITAANAFRSKDNQLDYKKNSGEQVRDDAINKLINNSLDDGTMSGSAISNTYTQLGIAQQKMLAVSKNLTAEGKLQLQQELDRCSAIGESVRKSAEELSTIQDEVSTEQQMLELKNKSANIGGQSKAVATTTTRYGALSAVSSTLSDVDRLSNSNNTSEQQSAILEKLKGQVDNLKSGFEQLGNQEEILGKRGSEAFNKLAEAIKDGNPKEITEAYIAFNNAVADMGSKSTTAIELLAAKMAGLDTEEQKVVLAANNLRDAQEAQAALAASGTASAEELAAADDEVTQAQQKLTTEETIAGTTYTELKPKIDAVKGSIDGLAESSLKAGQAQIKMTGQTGVLKTAFSSFGAELKKNSTQTMSLGSALTSCASVMMSWKSAISTVTSAVDTFNKSDKNLSDVITLVTSCLITLIPAITSVISILPKMSTAITVFGGKVSLAMWQVTLIVAAIAALIAIGVTLYNSWKSTTLEERLKAAKEEAENLKTALSDAKTEADNVKSAFEKYKEVTDKLGECTQGTDEWNTALSNVNQQVLELLQTYPELAKYINRNSKTGQLSISDEGWAYVSGKATEKVVAAQAASMSANENVRDLQEEQLDRIVQKAYVNGVANTNNTYIKQATGTTHEETVVDTPEQGHWVNPFYYEKTADAVTHTETVADYKDVNDNDVIAAIRERESELIGLAQEEMQVKIAQIIFDKGWEVNAEYVAKFTQGLVDSGFMDALTSLTDTINENNTISEVESQVLADLVLTQSGAYSDEVAGMAGDIYHQAYTTAREGKEASYSDKTNRDAAAQIYEETMGLSSGALKDKNDYWEYYDEATEETVKVTKAQMASVVAATEATDVFTENMKTVSTKMTSLAASENKADTALHDFLQSKDFSNQNGSQMSALQDSVKKAGGTKKYLGLQFGGADKELSDEEAQVYGYESAEAFIKAFEEGIQNWDEIQEHLTDNMLGIAKDAYSKIDTSEMSQATQTSLISWINNVFKNMGSDALNSISAMFEDLSAEDQNALAGVLSSITDFSNLTADDLRTKLEEAGITVSELSDGELAEFIKQCATSSKSVSDLTSAYAAGYKVISGLSTGDTISADDYSKLGDGYSEYFTLMMDGTYKLIGSAEELKKAYTDKQIEEFAASVADINKQKEQLQNADKIDINAAKTLSQSRLQAGSQINDWVDLQSGTGLSEKGKRAIDSYREVLGGQISLIQSLGQDITGIGEGQIEQWQADLEEGKLTSKEIEDIYATLDAIPYDNIKTLVKEGLADADTNIETLNKSIVNSASSLADLDVRVNDVAAAEGMDDNDKAALRAQGLLTLASSYKSCEDEIAAYNAALANADTSDAAAAAAALENAVALEEMAAKYGITVAQMEAYQNAHEEATAEQAAKALIKHSATSDMAKNKSSYAQLGEQSWASLASDDSQVTSLTQAQTDLKNILDLTNLTLNDTHTLLGTINAGEDAFVDMAIRLGATEEAARALWDSMIALDATTYFKDGEIEVEALNQALADGEISLEDYKSILSELLNMDGVTTTKKIEAINAALEAGKITAAEAKTYYDSVLSSVGGSAETQLEAIDEMYGKVDASGKQVYTDAELRAKKLSVISNASSTEGSQWQYNQYEALAKSSADKKELYNIRQQQLSAISGAGNGADQMEALSAWFKEGSITAYQYGQALSSISDDSVEFENKLSHLKEAYANDSKGGAEAVMSLIQNSKDFASEEDRIKAMTDYMAENPKALEYTDELISNILNNSGLSTQEKIKQINELLDAGVNAKGYGEAIAEIVNGDENYTAAEGMKSLLTQENTIRENAANNVRNNYSEAEWNAMDKTQQAQAKQEASDRAWTEAQVDYVDSLDTSQFDNVNEIVAVYGTLTDEAKTACNASGLLNEKVNEIIRNSGSIAELQQNIAQASAAEMKIDFDSVSGALQNLASQYDNCSEELANYQRALKSGNDEQIAAAEGELAMAVHIGELGKKYDISSEDIENYAKAMKNSGKYTGIADKELAEMAKDQLRYDKAVTSASSNMSKWQTVVKTAAKTGYVAADSASEMATAYGNMLDLDASGFSQQFLSSAKNLELMQKALDGDVDAYNELLSAARSDLQTQLAPRMDSAAYQDFVSKTDDICNRIANVPDGMDISASLDVADFLNELTNLVNQAEMTATEATNYLSSMGIDAEIEEVPAETTTVQTSEPVWNPPTYEQQQLKFGIGGSSSFYWVSKSGGGTWNNATNENEEESSPSAFTLKVTSAKKSSGGNLKKTNSGGSSRRGGGGGGSRRRDRSDKQRVSYTGREEKAASDEIERYHHITNALQSIAHELNMIGKAKAKAFGKDKLKAIDDETAALKKEKAAQEEYLKEINEWAEADRADALSVGLELDEEGHVTNYEQKMTDWINDYNSALREANSQENAAVDWWNSLSAEDQEQQTYKDLYEEKVNAVKRISEVAQEEYDTRKGILEQYEETMDLLDTESENYQDILDSIRAAALEKIQYVVELDVEVSDDALNILKDYIEDIGDEADGAADALANFAKQAEQVQKQVSAYQTGVQSILGLAGADAGLIDRALSNDLTDEDWNTIRGLDLTSDDVSTLEEYEKSLLSLNNSLREMRDNALAKINTAFEEYNEDLDTNTEKIEHLQKVNSTYADIVDVVGKKILDSSEQLTNSLNKADFEMQRNNTHALKSQLDFIDNSIAQTQAEYDKAVADGMSEETQKALKDSLESMQSERDSAYEEWLDSWKAECEAAATIYEDTLTSIIDTFNEAMGGAAGSLEDLQDAFDQQKTLDDTYLEEYDQIYKLSKLTRDINNSIDDTDNVNSKKALKKLTEEINKLQEEGNDLSQYDVDALQKKYELELAREQLEEARDAKTAVRMTRDAEGNYGYVYTANSDEVEKAEQNYEDKLYAMQKLNSDYIDSMQDQILQAESDCSAALAELNASDYATYEEYQAAALEIQQNYGQLVDDYYSQLQNAIGNNNDLYEGAWSDYSEETGYALDREKEFVTTFGETQLSILGGYNTIEDASITFHDALADAMNDSCAAWEEWYNATQIALSDGGTSIGSYADDVLEAVNGANGLTSAAQDAEAEAATMEESFNAAFDNILDSLDTFLDEWDKKIEEQIKTNQLLSETIYDIIAEAAGTKAATLHSDDTDNPDGYDTGGYTGNWNTSDGKVAILHQKELVLNADDTENILDAVDAVRSISNMIDLNAATASAGLASSLQSPGVYSDSGAEQIEQQVTINAQFTDATTASEITEALDSLINRASQYANRKT